MTRQNALSFLSWFVSLFLMFGPLYKPQVLVRVSLVFSHLPELIFRISASFFWSKPKRPASAWPSQTPAMVIPSTRLLHSFAAWKTWWLVSYGHNCLWDFSILAEMQANPQGKANIQERNIAILGLSGRKWPNVQISDSKLQTPVHPLISKKELTLNSCNRWAEHLATSSMGFWWTQLRCSQPQGAFSSRLLHTVRRAWPIPASPQWITCSVASDSLGVRVMGQPCLAFFPMCWRISSACFTATSGLGPCRPVWDHQCGGKRYARTETGNTKTRHI